jgi:hypothetical protein
VRVYAGIGSRRTPPAILQLMELTAEVLADEGWTLRSGHAEGADQAFERGAGRRAEVYLPWPSFGGPELLDADVIVDRPTSAARNIASQHHPRWAGLSRGAQLLHARNVHQVLGRDCNQPACFVLCWTPGATGSGGTGQAIRIARAHDVPVYDLARGEVEWRVARMVEHLRALHEPA